MEHKRILTVQDYSSVGRCSLTAAIPILSACGQDVVGLPTSLLSTQTYGIQGFTFVDLYKNMLPSYRHWESLDINFDCFYSGFLGSMDTASAALTMVKSLKENGTLIAVDPAMAESGELYKIFDNAYRDKMEELCRLADVVMPNFTEGKMLAGISVNLESNEKNARMILDILNTNGYKCVLLSGVKIDDKIGTALLYNGEISFQMNEAFEPFIHGAGDCLSSVFIGKLMSGYTYQAAAQAAVDFCHQAIAVSLKENVDLRYGLLIERCLSSLYEPKPKRSAKK